MKVCVYAICKNESKFILRWLDSMKEADKIFVLDTGSLDSSVSLLKENGVIVKEKKFDNFRFDDARNLSLEMVDKDTDICVCSDIDEVFEKGWREKLEKVWENGVTRASYTYNWRIENDRPIVSFYSDKIHAYGMYKWTHPVHEVLMCEGNERKVLCEDIVLNHFPDDKKSRSSYLKLLELSVKEDPLDDRNMHYFGREYMYYGKYKKAIKTLKKHLLLEKATWADERCASMRFIGRCYKYLNDNYEAIKWYLKAISEAPHLREGYGELGILYYEMEKYEEAVFYLLKAAGIKKNYKTYITEYFCQDFYLYDVISVCLYNIGKYKDALVYVCRALDILKDDRILNNKKLILEKIDD